MRHPGQSQEVLKAHTTPDLLALLPEIAGFQPRNSVVLLAFDGRRTCGAIRFNLPSSANKAVEKRFAQSMVGTLSKLSKADSAVVAIYSEASLGNLVELPHSTFARQLEIRLGHAGFGVRELLYQGPEGWGSYYEPQLPAGLQPLKEITESSILVNRASPALPTIGPEGAGADHTQPVPVAPVADVQRMRGRLDDLQRAFDEFSEAVNRGELHDFDIEPPQILQPLADIPGLAEAALAWLPHEFEEQAPVLLFALQGPPARDAVMLQWATSESFGGMNLYLKELDGQEPAELTLDQKRWRAVIEKLVGDRMLGIGTRPDVGRVEEGIRLLRVLVSLVEGRERLAPLCMLAWLTWALGMGSTAGIYIDEARSIDPDYGMAVLLDTMLSNGMLPEWAFNPE